MFEVSNVSVTNFSLKKVQCIIFDAYIYYNYSYTGIIVVYAEMKSLEQVLL